MAVKKMYKIFTSSFKYVELSFIIRYFIILLPFEILKVIKSGSLSVVDKKLSDRLFKIRRLGLKFREKDFPLVREILLLNNYLYDFAGKYGVVVDFGSNCGIFSILSSKNARQVFGAELNKDIINEYDYLRQINNAENCSTINKAIGQFNTENSITVDEFIDQNKIDHIDFLKIDIEGAEREIFIAGDSAWLNIVSVISIEVHPCFGVDVKEIMDTLTSYGFKPKLFDRNSACVNTLTDRFGFIYACR